MKLICDFDGVVTEQSGEARRVKQIFQARTAELLGLEPHAVAGLFGRAEAALTEAPRSHGWRFDGRITAFCDEDLFVRNNAIGACFDAWAAAGDPELVELHRRVEAAGVAGGFSRLSNLAYAAMVEETRAGHHRPLEPLGAAALAGLYQAGIELVIVSNSGTDRILELLAGAGLEAADHQADPTARFRVRGGARKYELGPHPELLPLADFDIDIARPAYRAILEEEEADGVIGDVFSLDLALPLHLTRTDPARHGGCRLFLRVRDYTPQWALDLTRRDLGVPLRPVEDLGQLAGWLAR